MPASLSARRRFGSLFLAIALLLLQMAPAMATEITTDLWVYNYGDTVTVTGVDYAPLETVELVTTDPYAVQVDRGQVQADAAGGFIYQFVLLSDVPGIYDIVGTGLTSGLVATTQFDPADYALTAVAPASVQYSDVVSFSGTLTCTKNGGGSNCPTTQAAMAGSTVEAMVQFNPAGPDPLDYYVVASTVIAAGDCTIHDTTATNGLKATCTWSMSWQAGRTAAAHSVPPATYPMRFRATGGPTGNPPGSNSTKDDSRSITISAEQTSTEYLGDTSATEGTSLNVSADVDDLDGGAGAGNGQFSPDANLASTAPATNGVRYQLWDAASCTGTSAVGPIHDDVDGSGGAAGASLSLAAVTAGTYYLKTTYLSNAYYLTSSDCDTITVTPADSTGPTISITTASPADSGTGWYNVSSSGTGGIDVDVSASDTSGVASFDCSIDGGALSPYDPTGDVIHLGDGQHTIYCEAEDTVGNPSNSSEDFDVDQTNPTVSIDPARSPDFNGWYNAPVTFNTSGSDATSLVDDGDCTADQPYSGPDSATAQVSGTCFDGAGNSASDAFDFMFDDTDPTVSIDPARSPDFNGWYNAPVTFNTSGSDATSLVDDGDCTADQPYSGPDSATAEVSGTCFDGAGNSASDTFDFMFDDTDPTVAVTFPLAGGSYNAFTWNAGCGTAFSGDFCGTGSDALSGLDTVQYSVKQVSSGMYWDGTGFASSSEVLLTPSGLASWMQSFAYSNFPATGDYTIRAVATDEAANTEELMVSFTINNPGGPYDFEGFFSPVNNPPAVNQSKAGQSVPVKWRITEAGVPVSDPNSFVALTSRPVACADLSTLGVDAIEVYTGSSGLQYLGDGNWQFNWKTPKNYAGTCRIMTLTLNDGSTHDAYFQFK